ncbi:MAG TPA: glucodextranase DOMON-like domain-containing protein [Myxococcota bacterium]|nr:glucodextranase DOMON-like domain-containing protein [Myxococcota bacterium]
MRIFKLLPVCAAMLGLASPVLAEGIVMQDPAGDDNGSGSIVYPSASEYKPGSFDVTKVEIKDKGDKLQIKLHLKAKIEDPWHSRDWPVRGNGFSLQMAFLFVDKDHKAGSGHTQGIPGLNVKFAPDAAWEKVVIISPQGITRIKSEINTKARVLKADIVLPVKVKASGKKIIATVSKKDLGDPAPGWGYQLVIQSNEGYPAKTDLLTRKVNESRGEHRFGGGRDDDCDPQVIDMLMSPAKGDKAEIEKQHELLKKYSCAKPVELPMVYP